jgi:hypothetical protein
MENIKFYGFIKVENGHYINVNDLATNSVHTEDTKMFMVTWIGYTPEAILPYLEIVVDNEEQTNQILSGEL